MLSNDCVIIPGLGGFMTHHVEAHYDADDRIFLPPLRTLGFNPQLKLNDSLLIQSYIEAYDISYPEAQRRVEAEVAELRQHLETEGHYELNDIGDLHLNAEGRLEFEPCEAGILTPTLYGLNSFEMLPLQSKVAEAEAETSIKDEETEATEEKSKREHTITIKMSWFRNAVAVAAAIVAFMLIGTPVGNSQLSETYVQQSAFVPLSSVTKAVVAEPAEAQEASNEQAPNEQAEETAETTIEETKVAEEVAPYFQLVLASLVTQHNAEIYIDQMKTAGFDEVSLYQTPKMLRVVYGNYASETDAYNALRQLRSQSRQFAEAWVLKIEKQ